MEKVSLAANTRTAMGKKVAALRADAKIPGVVYGHGVENKFVVVPQVPFQKVLAKAGESSLVDLTIDDGQPVKVLIHDVSRDPVTSEVQHVDFYQVKMTEKLKTHIPVVFTGDSRAVKELGGVLVKALDEVKVECLPGDLVHELTVDISTLTEFNQALTIADIVLPPGIVIDQDAADVIATVKPPKTEEELAAELAAPVSADVTAVEVEEKGKKEEEGAEGAAVKKDEKPEAKKEEKK